MNNKRKLCELTTTYYEKRSRRSYTLEEKLEIIKLSEHGERNCDISKAFGIRESTLRTICSQADKIKASYQKQSSSSSPSSSQQVRAKINLMDNMENQLILWINKQYNNNIEINTNKIREKAIRIYNELKINNNHGVQGRPFVASDGWLERFKKRANLDNFLNANNQMRTNEFSTTLKQIIKEDGYISKQVFCIDETELYWKRIPCDQTLIGNNNNNVDVLKDHLSLMFCINANGDYRLKPLAVYHIENPKVLDGYSKDHLPVVWRSNPQAKITTNIFIDYFCNRLTNELKDYCCNEGIPFKILLILSNTSSVHSSYLMDLSKNIRVISIPSNDTTTIIHPLKQGVINAFKSYYIKRIYLKLIETIDKNDDGQQIDFKRFHHNFTIKQSIDFIHQAWHDINSIYLNRSWRLLWPECLHDYKLFDFIDDVLETKHEILMLIERIGLTNITNIDGFLNNNNSNGDKLNGDIIKETIQLRTLTTDRLNDAFENIENAMKIFDEYDPDRERSARIIKNIENSILSYKQIYNEKKRANQQLIATTTTTTTNLSNHALLPKNVNATIKLEDNEDT